MFITFFFFETRKLKLKEAICPYPQGRQKRWSQASRPACFSKAPAPPSAPRKNETPVAGAAHPRHGPDTPGCPASTT